MQAIFRPGQTVSETVMSDYELYENMGEDHSGIDGRALRRWAMARTPVQQERANQLETIILGYMAVGTAIAALPVAVPALGSAANAGLGYLGAVGGNTARALVFQLALRSTPGVISGASATTSGGIIVSAGAGGAGIVVAGTSAAGSVTAVSAGGSAFGAGVGHPPSGCRIRAFRGSSEQRPFIALGPPLRSQPLPPNMRTMENQGRNGRVSCVSTGCCLATESR
jgi:hypothetical protein